MLLAICTSGLGFARRIADIQAPSTTEYIYIIVRSYKEEAVDNPPILEGT